MKEITQDDWMQASASQTLDLAEMDKLIQEREKAWEEYEKVHKEASRLYAAGEVADAAVMEALEKSGRSKYFVEDLGTVSVISKSVVRIPASPNQKKQFFDFLRSRGEDVFLNFATVNSNALNAWYNNELEEHSGKGLLGFSVPGIDQPVMRKTLRLTKDRKKKGKTNGEEE